MQLNPQTLAVISFPANLEQIQGLPVARSELKEPDSIKLVPRLRIWRRGRGELQGGSNPPQHPLLPRRPKYDIILLFKTAAPPAQHLLLCDGCDAGYHTCSVLLAPPAPPPARKSPEKLPAIWDYLGQGNAG